MLAYPYVKPGKFELQEKPKPGLKDSRDHDCEGDSWKYLYQRSPYQTW